MFDELVKPRAADKASWGYVSEVDALRAPPMTAVFAKHCNLMPFGWAGVWLFFVISGFAITSSLLGSARFANQRRCFCELLNPAMSAHLPNLCLIVFGSMLAAAWTGNREALGHWPWIAAFTYNYLPILHREHWG
jgi:hypothetical protein